MTNPLARLWPMPSWLLSLVIHAAVLIVMGLLMHEPPRGAASEPGREVGVVLKRTSDTGQQFFESADDQPRPEANPTNAPTAEATKPLADVVSAGPPIDLRDALPKGRDLIGIGAALPGGAASASGLIQSPAPNKQLKPGFGSTKVYGVVGQGHKFIYVFDRSASMGGGGNNALRSAKTELLASLDSLGPSHQFQIIFYNEQPRIFSLAGSPGRLVFANDANKRSARNFVLATTADGGTNHLDAITMALRLDPDVVFFLTDADQPGLTPNQLDRIIRSNQQASINCIEFGQGAKTSGENFLQRLSTATHGQYLYIDLSRQQPGEVKP